MKRWILLAMLLLCASRLVAQEALTVGVVPYLTPNVLMALFNPVRQQLARETGREVDLYTAADVPTFIRKTFRPDFDIVITAAHHARLAQIEGGYQPLARFSGPLRASVIVPAGARGINALADLRGKRVALTDRTILVNIATVKNLADVGITEQDVQFVPVNSQNTGVLAVARGDVDAAVIAHFTLDQIPPEQRRGVRVLHTSADLPNVVILARAGLPPALQQQLRAGLLRLPDTPEGREFLQKSRFQGIVAADADFLKTLDPYMPETRKQLETPR